MKKGELLFDRHYPALDFLRAVAITMVMVQHFAERVYKLPDGLFNDVVMLGWYGVDLFFALSGFLIGGQIIESLSNGRFSFKEFYIKRTLRIFPPYYVSLVVLLVLYFTGAAYFVIFAVHPSLTESELLKSLAVHTVYLQNYISVRPGFDLQNAIYWSLAVEEQFYFFIPGILYLLYKLGRSLFAAGLLVMIAAALAVRSAVWFYMFDGVDVWKVFIRPFHTRFDALVFGVLAAYLFLKYKDRLSGTAGFKFLIGLITAVSLGVCATYTGEINSYFYSCSQFTLRGLGFAGLVLLLAVMPLKVLFGRFFSYIAKISYSMYLYHLMLITATNYVLVKILAWHYDKYNNLHFILVFSAYFLLVVLASGLTYLCIDKPCMNYRKKIIERMRARGQAKSSVAGQLSEIGEPQ